jgi:hypothetical protein
MKQIILITTALYAMVFNAMALGTNNICAEKKFSDSLLIGSKSLKKNAIKLYPNPTVNGTVTIGSNMNAELHFYVFDMTGTLLHEISLKARQRHILSNLKKGIYMYDVFLENESIEGGKIIAK